MSLPRRLAAASIAAGATTMGLATVAHATLQVYDHTSAPLSANSIDAYYYPVSHDGAVLYMDGTFKRSVEEAGAYTYYDQDGNVTTPIDAADKTADAVWFTYHDFMAAKSAGGSESSGHTGVFAYTGSGAGVAAHPYNGNVGGQPLFEVEHGNDPDIGLEATETEVHSGLSFTTGHAVMFAQGGLTSPSPGWGGSTSWFYRKGFSGRGFVGFALEELDGPHYGWVEVGFGLRPTGMTIYGWAYQDLPFVPAALDYTVPMVDGDVDGDFDVDIDDVEALCAVLRGEAPNPNYRYDLSDNGTDPNAGGGVVDMNDLDYLVHYELATTIGKGTEYGDFNLDGLIDTTDLTRLATNFGTGTTWADGNANVYLDLLIDTTDLTILATYFGFGAPDAIPEPMTLSLLALGAAGLIRRRATP